MMTELLQIGLIVLIGMGHVKLLLDAEPMESTDSERKGVPCYLYGQFVRYLELK